MTRTRSEVFGRAVRTAVRNPGRSILTMLGLAIGVAAFIAMVSFGSGARRSVLEQFEILGTRIVLIRSNVGRTELGASGARPLGRREISALGRESTAAESIVPIVSRLADVTSSEGAYRTTVTGTTPVFTEIHDWPTQAGGTFDATDSHQRAKVCVVGETVARELFGFRDAVGRIVTIDGNLPCRIVGVLVPKGQSTSGRDIDDLVLLPITTFEAFLGTPRGYDELQVRVRDSVPLETAIDELRPILRQAHQLDLRDPDDFRFRSPVQAARSADYVSRILTGLLVGIAAVSLLVGGIGVMNIQFVSVAERTKEIGIRSAIGASPRQILVQFLSEAIVLSCTGSAAGVLLGWLAASTVAGVMGWKESASVLAFLGSALFGVCVGVGFGYLPARRAAQLEPIEALRHE